MEAEKIVQMYALIAWNGKTKEEAKKIVEKTSYEELDKVVYTDSSIKTAKQGIEDNKKQLATKEKYKVVIKILDTIHTKWVEQNAKKYDRGNSEKSKCQLFQHLPTALIGLNELSRDLLFLAPYLKQLGIDAGEMQNDAYGSFVPSKEIEDAYYDFVEKYKDDNNIKSEEDLIKHIEKMIDSYKPLQGKEELQTKRREYMQQNVEDLVASVKAENGTSFTFGNIDLV